MSMKPPVAGNVPTTTAVESGIASVEELVAGHFRSDADPFNASDSDPVFYAPFACEVTAAMVTEWATGQSIPTSDTDYWTVEVRRTRAGNAAIIASKTTKTTGGSAVTARIPWTFDSATFDADNKVLQAGDIVSIAFTKTGTPNAWDGTFLQIRYVPT